MLFPKRTTPNDQVMCGIQVKTLYESQPHLLEEANKMNQPFHTDPDADILAFQTRSAAASGGKCILSSGHTIYNELAKTRPDVIHTLAQPDWPFAL